MFMWTALLFCAILLSVGVVWAARRGLLTYIRTKLLSPPPPPIRRPPTGGRLHAKPPSNVS